MYRTTLKKELLSNILTFRYVLIFFLFIALAITVSVIRTALYKNQLEHFGTAKSERMALYAEAGRYWQSRGLGITVEKKPNPLAIIAAGLENEMTRSFSLSEWIEPRTGLRKLDSPAFQYFLNLDMVLIVNIVCSLLALLLVFDAVCGEREQGTLKVLLAGPLPRDVVIIAKVLAGLITLVVPLLIAWLVGLFYIIGVAGIRLEHDQIVRLVWIIFLSIVYISFFFSLGIAISCWVRRSATSLVIALFGWIIVVLALPNLVPMVIDHFAPIPPRSKIVLEKAARRRDFEENEQSKLYAEMSAGGKYKDINELWQELVRIREERLGKSFEQIDRFYNSRIINQLSLNQRISRLSPSASFIFASSHFAGTGVRDYLMTLDEVYRFSGAYHETKQRLEQERRKRNPEGQDDGPQWHREEIRDAYDPSEWPSFEPKAASLASVLNECWIDIVMLCGATVVLFLFAFIGFTRYDPR